MRKVLSVLIAATLGSVAATSGWSQGPASPSGGNSRLIPSTADGALEEPEGWNCGDILPEYRQWLDEGNDPNDWVHVGKAYYVYETGEKYSWNDWIDWANSSGCVAEPLVQPEFAPAVGLLGPAIVTGTSVASAAVVSATREPMSPG